MTDEHLPPKPAPDDPKEWKHALSGLTPEGVAELTEAIKKEDPTFVALREIDQQFPTWTVDKLRYIQRVGDKIDVTWRTTKLAIYIPYVRIFKGWTDPELCRFLGLTRLGHIMPLKTVSFYTGKRIPLSDAIEEYRKIFVRLYQKHIERMLEEHSEQLARVEGMAVESQVLLAAELHRRIMNAYTASKDDENSLEKMDVKKISQLWKLWKEVAGWSRTVRDMNEKETAPREPASRQTVDGEGRTAADVENIIRQWDEMFGESGDGEQAT